jgi:multidrug efflux system membrane fusion protein
MSSEPEPVEATRPKPRRWRGLAVAGLALFAGLGIAGAGVGSRQNTYARLKHTAAERSVPTVSVVQPGSRGGAVTLALQGRLEAYSRAALFARVSGYVASWKADIGTAVKAGDVLAEIEAPDLDQQLFQAQSDLLNAQANEQLATVTNERYQALLPNSNVSRQAADEKQSDLAAKRALAKSAQANVARLQALSQYKRVVAPFDGVVTARNTDVGALINSGSTSGSELFVVSDTRRLRLYVSVPQNYVPAVRPGTLAKVTVPERPGKSYAAKVETGSGVVDAATGTMRTQLVVENPDRELISGAYANVHLDITGAGDVLSVPASAVIFDKGGLRVATVDSSGCIVFKTIAVVRDLGNTVEISSGITREDRVVQNPPDDLVEGDRVNVKGAGIKMAPPSVDAQKSNIKS